MTTKDKSVLKKFLSTQSLMSLATSGKTPWIANVYYVADDKLNLYFISPPDALHSQHIAQNPRVACAVADSHQSPQVKKIGLQLWGTASEVKSLAKIKWMLAMYNKLYPSTTSKFNFKNFETRVMTSRVYRITPKRIKFFNQALYPKTAEKIFTP